jgi:alpha-ribazole phosphatase
MKDPRDFQSTTIDFLRHGACEGGEIFRGSTDVSLSEMGWEQMRNSVASHTGWQQIICSSLQRCSRFAEWLSTERDVPYRVDERLREIHFGRWEGLAQTRVMAEDGDHLRGFWFDPLNHSPPEGEAVTVFKQRLDESLNDILEEFRGKHVLLVTHGAVIRMMMCNLLDIPLTSLGRISVPYACLTRIKIYEQENETPWIQLQWHGAVAN